MSRFDTGSRTLQAPPERVYDALTSAESLEQWLPPAGMTGRIERFDGSVGGGFRMVLTYLDPRSNRGKSSARDDVSDVEFAELVPGERVVWRVRFDSDVPAFAGTMTMLWALVGRQRATDVTVTATDVPDGISAEAHEAGIASSLENLAIHVESG